MVVFRKLRRLFALFFLVLLAGLQSPGKSEAGETRRILLQQARTWMYQIQDINSEHAIQALADTDYPLLVVEPNYNDRDNTFDCRFMVRALGKTINGAKRLVLAYVDIGQAENWRTYWKKEWVAPTFRKGGDPDFLVTPDPDGWEGCYPVAYWDQRWKDIWLGPGGIIPELAKLGFDGVYLDWVGAYDDEHVREAARQSNVNPGLEMIRFIEEIGRAGKEVTEGFLVIPQNAPFLIDEAPDRYAKAIDALAVEDTWFHGAGDADWYDPKAGDLRTRYDGQWSTDRQLLQYRKYLKRGLPVFSVDYCVKQENAAMVYREARKAGLRPLVTRVSLSRITKTPPR
ncbi:MAG: glycoside hydrolase, end-alpha-1,4-polygalactosaminidase [Deltaproteobacteria bacterium]|nr:glycoside hydrolase, end-alpha-1,4-polygalactosaminidase [Deltaproteobacteria bacterium]